MQVLRLDFADFDTIPNRADLDKTLFYYIGIKEFKNFCGMVDSILEEYLYGANFSQLHSRYFITPMTELELNVKKELNNSYLMLNCTECIGVDIVLIPNYLYEKVYQTLINLIDEYQTKGELKKKISTKGHLLHQYTEQGPLSKNILIESSFDSTLSTSISESSLKGNSNILKEIEVTKDKEYIMILRGDEITYYRLPGVIEGHYIIECSDNAFLKYVNNPESFTYSYQFSTRVVDTKAIIDIFSESRPVFNLTGIFFHELKIDTENIDTLVDIVVSYYYYFNRQD